MKKEDKSSKKTKKIVLIIIIVLLVLLAAFLYWFFNRKFDITFKVSDNEKYTIQVKYNHTINEKDIKKKEELGETFIGWYEVVSTDKNKDVLAKDSFDFSTKIKNKKSLKAVYEVQEEETITITFDTKGGNKIDATTIVKGGQLSLPENPTRDGYAFTEWTLANGETVKNNTEFNEDTTLYANWNKVEEPKKEEAKKEEKISLNLSRSIIHRNGYNTSKATANVENSTGEVTYEIDNNVCVSIDSKTGELTAKEVATGSGAKVRAWLTTCAVDGKAVTVTAKLPSGKSAAATLYIEKDLSLFGSDRNSLEKKEVIRNDMTFNTYRENTFSIEANQSVTLRLENPAASCTASNNNGTYTYNCTTNTDPTRVTVATKANQTLSIKYVPEVN